MIQLNFGKIIILNRLQIKLFRTEQPWALISIADTFPPRNTLPIAASSKSYLTLKEYLFLQFDDIVEPKYNQKQFTDFQAKQIQQFIEKWFSYIVYLVIHCNQGRSRSIAVAKAITERYQPEYSFPEDEYFSPNKLVYKKLKKCLYQTQLM